MIKELSGYSGSKVSLMSQDGMVFVRKQGQNDRNLERIDSLTKLGLDLPKILDRSTEHYDMQYIRHTDMVNWLSHNSIEGFLIWLMNVVAELAANGRIKDYLPVYEQRLQQPALMQFKDRLPFQFEQLLERLPRYLPSGEYHGDLTMDNCLHGVDGRFYLIDPLTSDYDGYVFDLVKLMQDLQCGWFIRNKTVMLHGKLWAIRSAIIKQYPVAGDPNLLILMLLRVLPYAKTIVDQDFLLKEIDRLWTS